MVNEQVIERLKKGNLYLACKTKQDTDLVLQACDDAGITWQCGDKATTWSPRETYPLYITFYKYKSGITYDNYVDYDSYEKYGLENITDWFFNAIKNNDRKLTPQNAEQEHLVQMLLAKTQGIPVECWSFSDQKWVDSTNDTITTYNKYRIKPEPIATPLPISRKLWRRINKKWKFIAMDKDGRVFLYKERPHQIKSEYGYFWCKNFMSSLECPLNINTDGIDWQLSLTERPEDV